MRISPLLRLTTRWAIQRGNVEWQSTRLFSCALLAAALVGPATSVSAATIVQNILTVSGPGDATPFAISGDLFNPAIGTLDAVSGHLVGLVTPEIFAENPPFPSPATLGSQYFLFIPTAGGDHFSGTLEGQTISPVMANGLADYKGVPIAVDLTFDFTDLSNFTGIGSAELVDYGFRATISPPLPHPGGSDLTTFSGTFALTYTYNVNVPEPESLLSFGFGLILLGLLRLYRPAGSRERATRARGDV